MNAMKARNKKNKKSKFKSSTTLTEMQDAKKIENGTRMLAAMKITSSMNMSIEEQYACMREMERERAEAIEKAQFKQSILPDLSKLSANDLQIFNSAKQELTYRIKVYSTDHCLPIAYDPNHQPIIQPLTRDVIQKAMQALNVPVLESTIHPDVEFDVYNHSEKFIIDSISKFQENFIARLTEVYNLLCSKYEFTEEEALNIITSAILKDNKLELPNRYS